ncbi:MAG: SIMPL domain-containing protein [Thermoleophilia bacterium]
MTGITVTGTAGVEARPDLARIHLGMQAEAATAAEAMAALETRVGAVSGALRAAGLGDADLRTAHLSVGQRYSNAGAPDGYAAGCAIAATVRDTERVGAVLDAAITAGATRVDGLSMEVADTSAAYARALDLAVEDARAKAAGLAAAAGLQLGAIEAVAEGGASAGGPPVLMAAEMRSAKGIAVEPGEQTVTATVTVRFATSPGSPARP